MKALTGGISAAIGAVAAIPGLGFLGHPLRHPTVSGGEEPLRVAAAADVKPGVPLKVDVIGARRDGWLRLPRVKLGACWLLRGADGNLKAFSTVCPHLGCSVDWSDETRKFECPCHGSVFEAAGRCIAGPAPRPLDELELTVVGDDVQVRYRRFRVSTDKKEPLG